MHARMPLSGERSTTVIAAMFADAERANRASARLRDDAQLSAAQVRVVEPGDPEFGRKLEPETQGIWRTARRTHVWLGLAGLVAGLLLGAALYGAGVDAFVSSASIAFAACALLGLFGGLLLAGVMTMRPDHDIVIERVRDAAASGGWIVVAHPADSTATARVEEALKQSGGQIVSSI